MTSEPDGLQAFGVAVAACVVQFTVFGMLNSFSVFTDSMKNDANLGHPTQTALSFGNSVGVGLSPVFGAFAGALSDRIGPRLMSLVSVAAIFVALWTSSLFADSPITLVFTFSLPAAVASGFMLSPGAAAATSWFHKHRTLGTGIAFCGGGLGSCILPALAGTWVNEFGWRGSFRLMSTFCVAGVVAACFVRYRPQSTSVADSECTAMPIINESTVNTRHLSVRELLFEVIFTRKFAPHFVSFTFFTWTFYALLYIVVPYASSMGKMGTVYEQNAVISTQTASTIMTSFGALQILGSLTMGFVAGRIGNKSTHLVCSILGTFSLVYLVFCRTYAEFSVALCAVGFATAGIFAVVPAMIANAYSGPNVGMIIGVTFLAAAIGGLSAPPAESAMQAMFEGNYGVGVAIMAVFQAVSGIVCFLWIDE